MIEASDYPNRVIGRRVLAPSDAVDRQVVAVNLTESPLAWLARRGMLTARQVAAGERLRGDHARAGLGARVTMRWDAAPGGRQGWQGGADTQAVAGIEARRRFGAAMAEVGPGLSDVLWRVACEGEGLAEAEKGLGWPVRAGKLVLGLALDRLVMHYDNQYGKKHIDNRDDSV
ncbi:DUF6456 domain-containing protein [Sandaracinobacteroides hominis]|uniref:DUF6456 domain-containing protein n=1 Tax=Sandaracinobacteroides hominis TaxID=2780086 RepID=UPI001F245AAB|nr:DUF6456 domain-containing protein [Sandaracinobacteroides hominis]